ncbi:MAG: hypothetical protein ACK5N8_06695 [Alphaproteobacteria bacterium]
MNEKEIRKELVLLNLQRDNPLCIRELKDFEKYIMGNEIEDASTPSKAWEKRNPELAKEAKERARKKTLRFLLDVGGRDFVRFCGSHIRKGHCNDAS